MRGIFILIFIVLPLAIFACKVYKCFRSKPEGLWFYRPGLCWPDDFVYNGWGTKRKTLETHPTWKQTKAIVQANIPDAVSIVKSIVDPTFFCCRGNFVMEGLYRRCANELNGNWCNTVNEQIVPLGYSILAATGTRTIYYSNTQTYERVPYLELAVIQNDSFHQNQPIPNGAPLSPPRQLQMERPSPGQQEGEQGDKQSRTLSCPSAELVPVVSRNSSNDVEVAGNLRSQKPLGEGFTNAEQPAKKKTIVVNIDKTHRDQELGIAFGKFPGTGTFYVSHVNPDSPFLSTELAVGMSVLKINDIGLKGMPKSLILMLLKESMDITIVAEGIVDPTTTEDYEGMEETNVTSCTAENISISGAVDNVSSIFTSNGPGINGHQPWESKHTPNSYESVSRYNTRNNGVGRDHDEDLPMVYGNPDESNRKDEKSISMEVKSIPVRGASSSLPSSAWMSDAMNGGKSESEDSTNAVVLKPPSVDEDVTSITQESTSVILESTENSSFSSFIEQGYTGYYASSPFHDRSTLSLTFDQPVPMSPAVTTTASLTGEITSRPTSRNVQRTEVLPSMRFDDDVEPMEKLPTRRKVTSSEKVPRNPADSIGRQGSPKKTRAASKKTGNNAAHTLQPEGTNLPTSPPRKNKCEGTTTTRIDYYYKKNKKKKAIIKEVSAAQGSCVAATDHTLQPEGTNLPTSPPRKKKKKKAITKEVSAAKGSCIAASDHKASSTTKPKRKKKKTAQPKSEEASVKICSSERTFCQKLDQKDISIQSSKPLDDV